MNFLTPVGGSILVLVGVGCASLFQTDTLQGGLDKADKLVGYVCQLSEADRLPLRQELQARYGLDTSGVCAFRENHSRPDE